MFTPDVTRSALAAGEAVRQGLAQVGSTIADARRHHSVGRFLLANMVYQDALVALFAFGGIYGAGVFGWEATELGALRHPADDDRHRGALIGGRLDDRFGAKPVILGAITVLGLVCLGDPVARARPRALRDPDRCPDRGRGPVRDSAREGLRGPRPDDRRGRRPAPGLLAQPPRAPRAARRKRDAISACSPCRERSRPSWRR